MARHPQWRGRLAAFVSLARRVPFHHGIMDCVIFAQGWAEAVTGKRPYPEITYGSQEEGMAALRDLGFTDHITAAMALYPEALAHEAHYGDLAIVETPEGRALGGVGGAHVLIPTLPRGLGAIPLVAVGRNDDAGNPGRVHSVLKL